MRKTARWGRMDSAHSGLAEVEIQRRFAQIPPAILIQIIYYQCDLSVRSRLIQISLVQPRHGRAIAELAPTAGDD